MTIVVERKAALISSLKLVRELLIPGSARFPGRVLNRLINATGFQIVER